MPARLAAALLFIAITITQALLPSAIAAQKAADTQTTRPPNILLIMADEHNPAVLGCYGNSIVHTPNLDALARRGIRFDRAYTNSPLCVPSRLSFTAGRYVSGVSAWNNNSMLPPETPSLPRVMNAAGYQSYLCGKMHYDADQRYGFTEIGGNMNKAFMSGRGSRRAADDLTTAPGYSNRFKSWGPGEGSVIAHDRKVTSGVVEFLGNRRADDKPFFLLAGYLAPHFPLQVPDKYWEPYKGKVPAPKIPPGLVESLPLNYRHLRVGFHVEDVPEDEARKGRELYYGLTQWLDEEVGRVVAALEAAGLADNTVIIYTADHGEDLGEHSMWFKNCLFEHGARVPLIVSWPRRWQGGQVRSGACALVDVAQTIARLGGATVPANWNGTPMCEWMDNAKAPWRDIAVSEYYAHLIASGFAMVRTGDYKYVYHTAADSKHPAERELYNLKSDPGELRNLASDPAQEKRVGEMHALLVRETGEEPDKTEQRCRAEITRGYDRKAPAGTADTGKAGKKARRAQRAANTDDNE
jgi:choline-sulfatase